MDLSESHTQSFIVHLWIEETADEGGGVIWRGSITHVPSGRRRHLKDLDGIAIFIMPYLERLGVRFGLRWRLRQYLKLSALNLIAHD